MANERQVESLRAIAAQVVMAKEARSRPGPWGARPAGAATAPPGSVPRWADGTPRRRNPKTGLWETDRLAQLRESLDTERVNAGDQAYIAAHAKEVEELLGLEQAEAKRKPFGSDAVVVADGDIAKMRHDLEVRQLDEAIATFEKRKSALAPPAPKEKE